MRVNKTTSDCTIYAFTGTAILAISLVVAMYVGNDFHQSLFVESITFAGSNVLLWAIFLSMVNCPYELIMAKGNGTSKNQGILPVVGENLSELTTPQVESVQYTHDDYTKCVEAQKKKEQEEKSRRTKAILDYSHRTMARFLYEEDVNILVEEIRKWLEDCNYVPTAINRFKVKVENIPLRHFIWNIAERIGKQEYNLAMRIAFVKALFPKPFATLDYSTLKNIKAPCAADVIPIDEPANGGYDFHDIIEENPE